MDDIKITITFEDEKRILIKYFDKEDQSFVKMPGTLAEDPFARQTIERIVFWVNTALQIEGIQKLMSKEDLKLIGVNLYRILFGDDEIRKIFEGIYKNFEAEYRFAKNQNTNQENDARLRLQMVFKPEAEMLGRLPWEFLFIPPLEDVPNDKGAFFSGEKTELILTRFVKPPEKFPQEQAKLRILVAYMESPIEGMPAIVGLPELLDYIQKIGNSEYQLLKDPSMVTFRTCVENFQPHIVHFVGHGRPGKVLLFVNEKEEDYDANREDNKKQYKEYSSDDFASLFSDYKPRLVFLQSCDGASPSAENTFISTARDLVYADIQAVVAMQYRIFSDDANTFAKKFYEMLGKGRSVDEAVKAGRLALGIKPPVWGHPRFGTPVVYLQSEDAIIQPPLQEDTSQSPQVEMGGIAPVQIRPAGQAQSMSVGDLQKAPKPQDAPVKPDLTSVKR